MKIEFHFPVIVYGLEDIARYFGRVWLFIPIILLLSEVILTLPIHIYRKKYKLYKYEDIVKFFDEEYNY